MTNPNHITHEQPPEGVGASEPQHDLEIKQENILQAEQEGHITKIIQNIGQFGVKSFKAYTHRDLY